MKTNKIARDKWARKVRLFLIRNGVIKHRTMAECREAFPFPDKTRDNHIKWIGVARHVEALHWVNKK